MLMNSDEKRHKTQDVNRCQEEVVEEEEES